MIISYSKCHNHPISSFPDLHVCRIMSLPVDTAFVSPSYQTVVARHSVMASPLLAVLLGLALDIQQARLASVSGALCSSALGVRCCSRCCNGGLRSWKGSASVMMLGCHMR
jgi:hypothetical protein